MEAWLELALSLYCSPSLRSIDIKLECLLFPDRSCVADGDKFECYAGVYLISEEPRLFKLVCASIVVFIESASLKPSYRYSLDALLACIKVLS